QAVAGVPRGNSAQRDEAAPSTDSRPPAGSGGAHGANRAKEEYFPAYSKHSRPILLSKKIEWLPRCAPRSAVRVRTYAGHEESAAPFLRRCGRVPALLKSRPDS